MYCYVAGPFLTVDALVTLLTSFWLKGRNAGYYSENLPIARLLRQNLRLTTQKLQGTTLGWRVASKIVSSVVPFWLSFTNVHLSDEILSEIAFTCELLLELALSHGISPIMLRTRCSEILLQQCLATKLTLKRKQKEPCSKALMARLIDSDPIRFGSSFLKLHMEHVRNPLYLRIFHCGLLDQEICSTFGYQGFDKPTAAIQSVGELLTIRSQDICFTYSNTSVVLIGRFLSALLAFTADWQALELVPVTSLMHLASILLEKHDVTISHAGNWSLLQKVLLLALRLCGQKSDEAHLLSSTVLTWFVKNLPSAFEDLSADSLTRSKHLIRLLKELIDVRHSDNHSWLGLEGFTHLSGLMRSSLRYGMGASGDDDQSVLALCFQLVQSLVDLLHGHNQPQVGLVESLSPPFAQAVFDLLISHSNFAAVLHDSRLNSEESARLEMLGLMKSCLTASDKIDFNERVWRQLLGCYDAGTSDKDLLVRHILQLLAAKMPLVRCLVLQI